LERFNGIGFVLFNFDEPLLTRTTFHRSLDKSLLFIQWQFAGSLSGGSANADGNGGGSNASPINFFAVQSDENIT
jgi:hypothetical protein